MIDVKIEERFVPNVYLSVAYVKDGEMFESGKSINVPARSKFLNIEIIPDKKEYKPRDPARTRSSPQRRQDARRRVELSWASSTRPFTASGPTRRATSAARLQDALQPRRDALFDRLQLHRLFRQ